ncbi:hypothetical protein P12x_004875 [Tundrisphaera lichenicola]|uniref:hypothetical protein n=1 Tax=Tundrisphaera lichenicola TaxID=2029860 RepID=UPI003EB7A2AA
MHPTENDDLKVEIDERFPSGPWTGFFLQPNLPGRHSMDMILTFREGKIIGEGRDRIGDFAFKGHYQISDGKCWWTKTYLKQHSLAYQGYNEGKGIWGTWEYNTLHRGGFHIWPVAMGDPTQAKLAEAIEQPTEVNVPIPAEPVAVPGLPEEVAEPVSRRVPNGPVIAIPGR